jgi:hypothetical protein
VTYLERFLSFFFSHSHTLLCKNTHSFLRSATWSKKKQKFTYVLQRSLDHHYSATSTIAPTINRRVTVPHVASRHSRRLPHLTSVHTLLSDFLSNVGLTSIWLSSNFCRTFVKLSSDFHWMFIKLLSCSIGLYRSTVLPSCHFTILFDFYPTFIRPSFDIYLTSFQHLSVIIHSC